MFLKCSGCKAKDEEIKYLRLVIDRLQAKFGVFPVSIPQPKPAEEKEPRKIIKDPELGDIDG